MTRDPNIAEALRRVRVAAEEGAPQGAPKPSVPAGEPEAPVGPTSTSTSEEEAEDHELLLEADLEQLTAKAEKGGVRTTGPAEE